MPDDLENYEGLFDFYYDPRYDEEPNYFDTGRMFLDDVIHSMAEEVLGHGLSPEKMKDVKFMLKNEGCLQMNPGDPEFRERLEEILQRVMLARKVASNALRFK